MTASGMTLLWLLTASAMGFSQGMARSIKEPVRAGAFPENALAYVLKNIKNPEPMFNHHDWGGYVNWMYPQYKTFIDGRVLNPKVFEHYTHMLWTPGASLKLLDAYGINTVIIPLRRPFGGTEIYALVGFLNDSPLWRLAYSDNYSAVVFVRKR